MFLRPRRESNPQPSDLWWDALTIELPGLRWQREGHDIYRFVTYRDCRLAVRVSRLRTGTFGGLLSAIWVLVAQWLDLKRLTGDQKVAGSIPVWGSETFFWVCDKAWVANSYPVKSRQDPIKSWQDPVKCQNWQILLLMKIAMDYSTSLFCLVAWTNAPLHDKDIISLLN